MDAIEGLRQLADESVDMCVTSPPYWGLRTYGTEPMVWGGDPGCEHEWGSELQVRETTYNGKVRWQHLRNGRGETQSHLEDRAGWSRSEVRQGSFCASCGAWRGELGLEPTPSLYVTHLVEVFREVRRVLRKDRTLWLVLGDCYSTGAGLVGSRPGGGERGDRWLRSGPTTQPNRLRLPGLKPKDLVGVPWMIAFALRNDGWYLRSDIVWHKPNPMPESVTDRPTRAHEYVFLLSKSRRYFYDAAAIAEPIVPKRLPNPVEMIKSPSGRRSRSGNKERVIGQGRGRPGSHLGGNVPWEDDGSGVRNARTVWTIPLRPFPGAHFATFPQELVRRCVLAGSRPGEIILDPFMGSGTTAVVARELDRHFIGLELNPQYVKMSEARIKPLAKLKEKGGEVFDATDSAKCRRRLVRSHARRAA